MGFRDKFMAKSPFKVGEMKSPNKVGNMKSPANEGKKSSPTQDGHTMAKAGKMDSMANAGHMAKKGNSMANEGKSMAKKKMKMVKGPDGKDVPFYAADGKGAGDLAKKRTVAKKVDAYAEALKKDSKLPQYIKARKGLKKGTPEYNTVQNKINRAYGKQTRPEKAATLPQRTGQESTNNVKPAKPKKSTPSTPKQKPGLERMLDKAGEKARAKAAQRKADKEKKKKDKEARKTTREVTDDGTQTTKTIKKFDKEGNLKKTKTKIKKSKPKRVKRRDKKGKVTANMPAVDVVG